MLFYAYDLENYIATRDFYSGYEHFVPGRIVRSQEELLTVIQEGDYDQEKVDRFCRENFDIRDGKASERIAGFIRTRLGA
ncbi:MAG: CDP-glycerol glycerophosphotransferase family protein [Eubacterium sp.]|nr:CDP-glycerol glycerophosphotransferase family protein [Eubacterium sp.]